MQDEKTLTQYQREAMWAQSSTTALFDSGNNFGAVLVKNIADLHSNYYGGTAWPICGDTLAIRRNEEQ